MSQGRFRTPRRWGSSGWDSFDLAVIGGALAMVLAVAAKLVLLPGDEPTPATTAAAPAPAGGLVELASVRPVEPAGAEQVALVSDPVADPSPSGASIPASAEPETPAGDAEVLSEEPASDLAAAPAQVEPQASEPQRVAAREAAFRECEALWEKLAGPRKGVAKLVALRVELDLRRDAALAFIRDASLYYKTDGHKGRVIGQDEVDRRVAAVRDVFDANPALARLAAGHRRTLARYIDLAPACGHDGDGAALALLVRQAAGPLHLRDVFLGDRDRERLERDARVMASNEAKLGAIDQEEAKVVRLTNQYRVLLGVSALGFDERLHRAARGHSQDMRRLRFFSHTSPVAGRETPAARARAQGFPIQVGWAEPAGPILWGESEIAVLDYSGAGLNENIYHGSAAGNHALDAWLHSPGHHRNVVDPGANSTGAGRDADHWTQNNGLDPQDSGDPGPKGNNGVGNGEDPQPSGNPPVNDGAGTGPGNPGNKGGAKK